MALAGSEQLFRQTPLLVWSFQWLNSSSVCLEREDDNVLPIHTTVVDAVARRLCGLERSPWLLAGFTYFSILDDQALTMKHFWRYSFGQVETLFRHPLNRWRRWRVWLHFLVDQASVRIAGQRLQVCTFLDRSFLALSSYTAPGIHYSRVGCMRDHEEVRVFADPLRLGDVFIDVGANAGALQSSPFALVCVEANREGVQIRDFLLSMGFVQVRYYPDTRHIRPVNEYTSNQNGLFVKGIPELLSRLCEPSLV